MTAKISKKAQKSPEKKVATPKFKVKPTKSILKQTPTVDKLKQVSKEEKKKKKSKRISFDGVPTADEEPSADEEPTADEETTTTTAAGEELPEETGEAQQPPPPPGTKVKTRKPRSQQKLDKRADRQQRNEAAVQHLHAWHNNRSEWKYQRKLQAHLIQKCLSKHVLNKEDFSIFLDYANTIKGGSLQWLFTVCEEKLRELKQKTADSTETEEVVEDKTDRTSRVRANKILNRIRKCAFDSVEDSEQL